MKTHDGQTYITIGEVARRIGRVPQTLKYWLEWYDKQDDDFKVRHPLPAPRTDLDTKGTRFFQEADVQVFDDFKHSVVKYGRMADMSITKWGVRGREIQKRKDDRKHETEI